MKRRNEIGVRIRRYKQPASCVKIVKAVQYLLKLKLEVQGHKDKDICLLDYKTVR
jgi:hypothetical protein